MNTKRIIFFGQPSIVACDGKCHKAWGINKRPRHGENMLSDDELGEAPANPGTSEGGVYKPTSNDDLLNKWCVRECERSEMFTGRIDVTPDELPDFNKRILMVEVDVTPSRKMDQRAEEDQTASNK